MPCMRAKRPSLEWSAGAESKISRNYFRANSHSASRHLHDGAEDFQAKTCGEGHADHAFFADDADLDTSAIVAKSDEGGHAVIQEIGELDLLAGLLQDFYAGGDRWTPSGGEAG